MMATGRIKGIAFDMYGGPGGRFEAPIRIYLYESSDGTATLTYIKPSAVFKPYPQPEVGKVAAELDPIFEKIVAQALAVR